MLHGFHAAFLIISHPAAIIKCIFNFFGRKRAELTDIVMRYKAKCSLCAAKSSACTSSL